MVELKNIKTMKTQNKGGRPKLDIAIKKSHLISARVTEIELASIQTKAELAAKSISDFIREMALKGEVKAAISLEQMNEIRKLNGIGNNVNQLAKLAHQYGYSDEIHQQFIQIINQKTTTK